MITEYRFQVRGYELDSFHHVNNSVYLNYFEEARWLFFKRHMWEYLTEYELFPVVTEVEIKYMKELKIFEKALIKSKWSYRNNFIIAYQDIYHEESHRKITKSKTEMILVSKERIPYDLPEFIKRKMESEECVKS